MAIIIQKLRFDFGIDPACLAPFPNRVATLLQQSELFVGLREQAPQDRRFPYSVAQS
jgi:hypothetical protein